MATTAPRPASPSPSDATPSSRRRMQPGRGLLLGACLLVVLGSFLPWVTTAVGSVSGSAGAGLWTCYAAILGLAGVLVPVRTLAIAQAAVLSLAAVGLGVWQVGHVYALVGFGGWNPGPGLVLVVGGGVVAGVAAVRMLGAARAST